MKTPLAMLPRLIRGSMLLPLLLYAAARILTPYHKGVCKQTRWALLANKYLFDSMCRCVSNDLASGNAARARSLARVVARFASWRMVGAYSSPELEAPFLQLAEDLPMPAIPNAPEGTVHVMTQACASGGHTQIVRRWIELLQGQPHHLLITGQNDIPVPPELAELVRASGGTFICLHDAMPEHEAGMALRTLALQAKYVVLHTHMYDPLPIVAFGRDDFPRPVMVMNHADHKFWLCRSVTDLVLEMRKEGQELTRDYRGSPPTSIVSLPLAPCLPHTARSSRRGGVRRALGIPEDVPVFLTVAAPYKFKPIAPYDIREVILECLRVHPDSLYIVGGPTPNEPFWRQVLAQSLGRLRVLGPLSREALWQWFSVADIYIDSIPLGGGMTCLDAAQSGLPVVAHDVYRQAASFIRESGWEFKSSQLLIQGIESLVTSPPLQEEVNDIQNAIILQEHSSRAWSLGVQTSMQRCREHCVTREWPRHAALGDHQVFLNCLKPL